MEYNATESASFNDEVGDVLRDLVPARPLVNLCRTQAGTELVDLKETTGNREREDISMYAGTTIAYKPSLTLSMDRMCP